MFTIFKKELFNFFLGQTAYIICATFVTINVLFLFFFDNQFNLFNTGNATLNTFYFIAPWIMLFLIPALTMKMIAEEKTEGTLVWLLTMPIKLRSIVAGKYLAVIVVIIFCILLTFIFTITLQNLIIPGQSLDYGTILCGYLGLLLVSFLFAAIGLFSSAMAQNEIIAFTLALFISFVLFYGFYGLASYNLFGSFDYYIGKIGCLSHYNQLQKGVIDTKDVLYFIFLILLFVQATIIKLEKSK